MNAIFGMFMDTSGHLQSKHVNSGEIFSVRDNA